MQFTENQTGSDINTAMIISYNENLADDSNLIPLIVDDEPYLDATGIMQFILKGNSFFRLQDGFSIEYNFSINNGIGRDGVPVRFIKIKEPSGHHSYCGVIYCNKNDRFYYHQSDNSLNLPHVQSVLKVLVNNLKKNKKPTVKFVPSYPLSFM